MLTILNLAIGLSFVYLLFSLLVSALNELWLSFLDERTRFLREGMRELFQEHPETPLPGWRQSLIAKLTGKSPNDVPPPPGRKPSTPAINAAESASDDNAPDAVTKPGSNAFLLTQFYSHGLVNALSRGANGRPAYIDADIFTTAVLDIVRSKGSGAEAADELRSGIEAISKINPSFAQALNALFKKVEGNVDLFETEVTNWFNSSMDRVSGWYKRFAGQWLFALSLFLAVSCNVDTIKIITTLATDPNVLQSTVDQANKFKEVNPNRPLGSDAEAAAKSLDSLAKSATDALSSLDSATVPIGWSKAAVQRFYNTDSKNPVLYPITILSALFGWFLTALAASLGAPFWFDTLNRFINIRGNGRAPGEKDSPAKTGVN